MLIFLFCFFASRRRHFVSAMLGVSESSVYTNTFLCLICAPKFIFNKSTSLGRSYKHSLKYRHKFSWKHFLPSPAAFFNYRNLIHRVVMILSERKQATLKCVSVAIYCKGIPRFSRKSQKVGHSSDDSFHINQLMSQKWFK